MRRLRDTIVGLPFRIVAKLIRYRELLLNLTVKEIRVRYKQSLLGILWAIAVPVAQMMIFTFVFKRVAKVDISEYGENVSYAIFAYVGLLPWNFCAQGLAGCVTTLVTNRNLVTKIYFPREVFPLSKIFAQLLDPLIGSLVLVALMIGYGVPAQWTLVFVPVILVFQILFMIGCGLILSMANLFYRDVQYVFQVGIQLWMFATAVVYPIPNTLSPTLQTVLRLNPMTPLIEGYRAAILKGEVPDFATMLPALGVVAGILVLGVWAFDRAQYLFAERI